MTLSSPAPDRSLRLLCLASFVSMASMRWCDALVPVLAQEFGSTTGAAARVVYAFAIAYGVMQLIYGPLGDRLGKFRVVSHAAAACAVAALCSALAPSLSWLTAARAFNGAMAAGIIPLTMAWVGDNVPWEQRQAVLARLLGWTVTGMIAGQWPAGVFADTLGWRYGFGVVAACFAAATVGMRRHPPELMRAPQEQTAGPPMGATARMVSIARMPAARQLLLVTAVEGALAFSALAFAPTHLHQHLGLAVSSAGAIMALYGLGGLLYSRTVQVILRHTTPLKMARAGGLLVGACWLGMAWLPHWAWALPLCLLAGLGFYMIHNTLQTRATQLAPAHRGTAVSLVASALFMGQSGGMLLAAWLVDQQGTGAVLGGCGAGLALVGLYVARLPPDPVKVSG